MRWTTWGSADDDADDDPDDDDHIIIAVSAIIKIVSTFDRQTSKDSRIGWGSSAMVYNISYFTRDSDLNLTVAKVHAKMMKSESRTMSEKNFSIFFVQSQIARGCRMKVLDQLAGALGSLNLRKEERRKKKLELRKDQEVSRDQGSTDERSKEFMVEMFRKSIQDIGGETTLEQRESPRTSQNMRPGMKRWEKVDDLNSSHGSVRSRGSERSSMSSGRVKRTTTSCAQRKGDVEVLRFLSLRLVSLNRFLVLVALGLAVGGHLVLDLVLLKAGGKLYLCPLPGCQFSTNREGMDAGRLRETETISKNDLNLGEAIY